jgi:hypothetical protein
MLLQWNRSRCQLASESIMNGQKNVLRDRSLRYLLMVVCSHDNYDLQLTFLPLVLCPSIQNVDSGWQTRLRSLHNKQHMPRESFRTVPIVQITIHHYNMSSVS